MSSSMPDAATSSGRSPRPRLVLLILCVLSGAARADDLLLSNGIRLRGKIVEETAESIAIELDSGRRMVWPLAKVRSVTVGGKQRVFSGRSPARARPKPVAKKEELAKEETPHAVDTSKTAEPKEAEAHARVMRTRAEVEKLITEVGSSKPEWYDSTPLKYPRTLRLDFPKPRKGEKWTPNKYPAQYVISVINPNPGRWKEGARLFHYMLTVNKSNRSALVQTMERLGHIYGNLLGDYPRAAFWWRAAGKLGGMRDHYRVNLANCYLQLGNKDMAKEALRRLSRVRTVVVKLWAEIGDLDKALRVAQVGMRSRFPGEWYLAAANACRSHGRYDDAVKYYERILAMKAQGRRAKFINRLKGRARSSIQTVKVFEQLDLSQIPDGTYRGAADGYRGAVEVAVQVKAGRIESVKVVKHREDWFYTSLTVVPQRIVDRQGLKGVDGVSGATLTSTAIINATGAALAKAMR